MRGLITYLFVFISVVAFGQTDRDWVRSGNENYRIDSLNQAVLDYEKALEINPQMEEAKFNLGDAQYRAGKFADAAKTFNELGTASSSKEIKTNAHFNEGNSYMQAQKFEEAMSAFKNSMKADPANSKARYNYEFARKMLKEQQKQEQENKDDQNKDDQNKDDQNKDDKDKNKDQDKDKDKDNKGDKDDQDKDKSDKDDKDEENKDDQKDKGDQDQDKDKDQEDQKGDQDKDENKDKGDEEKDQGNPEGDDQQNQQPQPQPGQMSKADAERLLKAMEENEKKTRDKVALKKAKASKSKKSDKDW